MQVGSTLLVILKEQSSLALLLISMLVAMTLIDWRQEFTDHTQGGAVQLIQLLYSSEELFP